jgi:DNA-binding IclR family transcriptional regulator
MTDKERAGIQSVEVGFNLLQALAQSRAPLPLRDLALAANMSAAKAHRYLVSFARLQLVVQEVGSARYDLGPAALQLGLSALTRLDAMRLARERVGTMVQALGHTAAIAVWGNHGPVMVHWEDSEQAVSVNLRLGDVMPLLSSATGRCFAAFAPAKLVKPMLQKELKAAQQQGRSDLPQTEAQVQALLQETRQQGLGRVVDSLLPGVAGLCAPVFDANGRLALGLVCLGARSLFDAKPTGALAKRLKLEAAQLSKDLGFGALSTAF